MKRNSIRFFTASRFYGFLILAGICFGSIGPNLRAQAVAPTTSAQQPASQAEFHEVRWSPDGRSLAVAMRNGPSSPLRIAIISADGGQPRWLTPESQGAMMPRWSPDGREVSFLSGGTVLRSLELAVMRLDGGATRRVAIASDPSQFAAGYTWSLGGDGFIYFALPPQSERGHYTMDLSGHATRTPGTASIPAMFGVEWSADQSQIAFESGTPTRLYIAGSHGENPHRVAGTPEGAVVPSWSPDGRTLLYSLFRRATAGPTLWSIRADGSSNRPLAADGIRGQFSPDGQWVAYIDGRGTNSPSNPSGGSYFRRVCKARPDGSGVVVLAR